MRGTLQDPQGDPSKIIDRCRTDSGAQLLEVTQETMRRRGSGGRETRARTVIDVLA